MRIFPVEGLRVDSAFVSALPSPSEREFQGLLRDIGERGILVPLLATEDGLLLDGHRRLEAARKLSLKEVPVETLSVFAREEGWHKTVAIAVNLFRRQLNEAQRIALGSSLLRLERKSAAERKRLGQRNGGASHGRTELAGNGSPQATDSDRATERVAGAVGVSRKTFERAQAVARDDPETAKRMFEGSLSIAAAFKKAKVNAVKRRAQTEVAKRATGLLMTLKEGARTYRCVYLDPPWCYRDSEVRGGVATHYGTMTNEEIAALPVAELAHEEGAHFWIWTTWPMMREGAPHKLIHAWGLTWVGEIVWDKITLGTGHYFRSRTEVLILGAKGKLPLLSDAADPLVSLKRGAHSSKPEYFYEILERLSPGPRVELFARATHHGWDRWGNEA